MNQLLETVSDADDCPRAGVAPLEPILQKIDLISLIGEFNHTMRLGNAGSEALAAFDHVMTDAQIYFSLEEMLLNQVSRRKYREHRRTHRQILSNLSHQRQSFVDPARRKPGAGLVHSMDSLLVHLVRD